MTPALFLAAVVGCGVGATLRYGLARLDPHGTYPWPTLTANVSGSALVGALGAAVIDGGAPVGWLVVLGGGVAGGLSTFSTLAVDAVILWREHRRASALGYLALTARRSARLSAPGSGGES